MTNKGNWFYLLIVGILVVGLFERCTDDKRNKDFAEKQANAFKVDTPKTVIKEKNASLKPTEIDSAVVRFEKLTNQYLKLLIEAHKGNNEATLKAAEMQTQVYDLQAQLQEVTFVKPENKALFERTQSRLIKVSSEL